MRPLAVFRGAGLTGGLATGVTGRVTARLTAALLLVLAPTLLGCGSEQGPGTLPPREPSAARSTVVPPPRTETPSADALPTLTPPTGPPRTPSDLISALTVVGEVRRDGHGSCTEVVTPAGVRYSLVGPLVRSAGNYRDGARITVRGVALPQRSTACDGVVLSVRSIAG